MLIKRSARCFLNVLRNNLKAFAAFIHIEAPSDEQGKKLEEKQEEESAPKEGVQKETGQEETGHEEPGQDVSSKNQ